MPEINTDIIMQYVTDYGFKVLLAIAILVVGRFVAKLVTKLVKKSMKKGRVEKTIASFLSNIVYGLLLVCVVIAALNQLGIETTSLAAIVAAAGLAIGLSLKDSLSNFASGVMVVLFKMFKVGDFIEVNGTSGTVSAIEIFTTTLNTGDNRKVIIPNSAMTSDNIINFSANDTRRVDMIFGCGYGDDIKRAKDVLMEILKADERILEEPAPLVAVSELADSSVNFVVRPWVKTSDYWAVKFAVTEAVKTRFDEEGISIPFPQRDMHIYHIDGLEDEAEKA